MASGARFRMPFFAAVLLAVAIAFAGGRGGAQPTAGIAHDDEQQALVDGIQAAAEQGGATSPVLVELYTDLSVLYEDSGDPVLAMAAIERALDVLRVNRGLYSLDQGPLVQRLIGLEEARGDAKAAWSYEQQLLALARREPQDARAAEIFRAAGDRRVKFLERYRAGEHPPEIVLGCYYQTGKYLARDRVPYGNCASGNRSVAIENILADAAQQYAAAGDVAKQQEMERQIPSDWPRVIR